MPTLYWKKIGKGSWINIGGSVSIKSKQPKKGFLASGHRTGTVIDLFAAGFFDSKASENRTRVTLRNMGLLPEALHPFSL